MTSDFVQYQREGAIVSIVLDRPPVNAYDLQLHLELEAAWIRAAKDVEAKVVVLRAEGEHFCAGADTNAKNLRSDRARRQLTPWDELGFIRNISKPTIAAVQGACVGGGQGFVFPCDLIFCSEDAFFCDPLVKMGIGGIQAPVHTWLYGPRLAKEMLFSGMRMPAQRLYVTGAINRLYPRQDLVRETMAFAREVATQAEVALRQAKRSVNTTMDIAGQHYVVNRYAELLDDVPATYPNGQVNSQPKGSIQNDD